MVEASVTGSRRGWGSVRADPRVLLALVVLGGLLLRLVDAGARLNEDEGYTWLVATAPNAGSFLSRLARYENTPPLYYLLLEPLPLTSEIWLRLPSILAGTASIVLLYAIVRPLLGARAAMLAGLAWAVAPFAVSYADYARGFMVAGAGILLALLAAERLSSGAGGRWWGAWVLGGTWALYSEYYAAVYLAAIVICMLALGRVPRRATLGFGVLPFVAFAPWVPQAIRQLHDIGHTKLELSSGIHFAGVRDAVVALGLGEHGVAGSAAARDVQALVLLGLIVWGARRIVQSASRDACWLLVWAFLAAVLGYVVVTLAATDILRERYMTTLLTLGCTVLGGAAALARRPRLVGLTAALLCLLGVGIAVDRAGREYEPDAPALLAAARADGLRLIYTNTPVVAFYGRRLSVDLDRPFGIGKGRAGSCPVACGVIDDARAGGVRSEPGPASTAGTMVLRIVRRGRSRS